MQACFYIFYLIIACLTITIFLLIRSMKKHQEDMEKTIMSMLIIFILVFSIAGASAPSVSAYTYSAHEDLPVSDQPDEVHKQIVLLNPDGVNRAIRALLGEEIAVHLGHYLYLTNGTWVFENVTIEFA